MIGDGMGPEQIEAGRYLLDGSGNTPLSFETFPYQAEMTNRSADASITDSAAAATAMATGRKVNNRVLSVEQPGDGADLATSLELYRDTGRMTGLVTTTYVTHATPAAFGAHVSTRYDTDAVGEDYLQRTLPNVLFGGGGHGIDEASAVAAGYTAVTDAAELSALDTENVSYVSGQFGIGHMPYEVDGPGDLPHLRDMTATALNVLDNDPDGFFLMVEGGRIDHASHGNNLEYAQAEVVEFSNAVQVAIDWVNANSSWDETLIVVTADHETGGLDFDPATGTATWSTGGHTAIDMPIFAKGHNAESAAGTLDNTDIFRLTTEGNIEQPFTVVMMPDTQVYSENQLAPFGDQTQWIADNVASENLAFVSQLGDIVETANVVAEWTFADAAMDVLDGDLAAQPDGLIPYAAVPGNHDFDPIDTHDGATNYLDYFGPPRYAGRSWYGGSSADQTSSYQIFQAAGREFLHLALEWEPRQAALDWAQSVIDANPNLPVILATHAYLGSSGHLDERRSSDGHSGREIYQELVRPNPQVFLVLSGHVSGEYHQITLNDAGQEVIEILADYQGWPNGGNGFMQLLEFDPHNDKLRVQTYSPTLDQYETDANSQFTISLDFDERFQFEFPPGASLAVPLDNGPDDLDPAANAVTVKEAPGVVRIELEAVMGSIQDDTVIAGAVAVTKDAQPFVDFVFSYDGPNDTITLTPSAAAFADGTYDVLLSGAADKIEDTAGTPMEPLTLRLVVDTSISLPETAEFQQGVDGYASTVDTMLQEKGSGAAGPNVDHATTVDLSVDDDDPPSTAGDSQALVRFDDVIGNAAGQVPSGSLVNSATLTLRVSNEGSGLRAHRLLVPWTDTDTWNRWNVTGGGVLADGIQATVVADDSIGQGNNQANVANNMGISLDVTASVQAWADGQENHGWALLPFSGGSNGLDFYSAEASTVAYRPKLAVEFVVASQPVNLVGTDGDDTLRGDADDNLLDGGDGTDTVLFSGEVEEYVFTLDGDGRLVVTDTVADRDGSDTLVDVEFVEFAGRRLALQVGTTANESLLGTEEDDLLLGFDGDDSLYGQGGDDVLMGGDGNDVLRGGAGNDRLTGGDGDDLLWGDGGDDTLQGGEGDDSLHGTAGADHFDAGDGNDNLYADGADQDTILGGPGLDYLFVSGVYQQYAIGAGHGIEQFFGGVGDDSIDGSDPSVEGPADYVGNDGDDRLTGGPGDDQLQGGAGDDVLVGNGGDDVIRGGDGDDSLDGGVGTDLLMGEWGENTLEGGAGPDTLVVDAVQADTVFGGAGYDVLTIIGAYDALAVNQGHGIERFNGGVGDDSIDGSDSSVEGPVNYAGNGGNDQLTGGDGNDILRGGPGDDLLYGRGGNDMLLGDTGTDTVRLFGAIDEYMVWIDAMGNGSIEDQVLGRDGRDSLYRIENTDALGVGLPAPPPANAADVIVIRDNPRGPANPASFDDPFDLNRDRSVDAIDMILVRDNAASPLSALQLLTPRAASPAPLSSANAEGRLFPRTGEGESTFATGSLASTGTPSLESLDGMMATQATRPAVDSLLTSPMLGKLLRRFGPAVN